jgi:hypothetical protein
VSDASAVLRSKQVLLIYRALLGNKGDTDPVALLVPSSLDKPFPGVLKALLDLQAIHQGERAREWVNHYNDAAGRRLLCPFNLDADDVELWSGALYVILSGMGAFTGTFTVPANKTAEDLFAEWVGR